MDGLEVDRQPVEAYSPTEDGECKSTANDAPTVKDGRSGLRAIGQDRPPYCLHPASLPQGKQGLLR